MSIVLNLVCFRDASEVVLGGEVAVPCRLQSAIAGLNPS
jgi:hypothetical protein